MARAPRVDSLVSGAPTRAAELCHVGCMAPAASPSFSTEAKAADSPSRADSAAVVARDDDRGRAWRGSSAEPMTPERGRVGEVRKGQFAGVLDVHEERTSA